MTQDLETILQKSLDEVDRGIKFFVAAWLFIAILVVAGLLWLGHLSRTSDIRTMLLVSVIVLLFAQSVNLVLSSAITAKMARKILKAIELSSRA